MFCYLIFVFLGFWLIYCFGLGVLWGFLKVCFFVIRVIVFLLFIDMRLKVLWIFWVAVNGLVFLFGFFGFI